MVEPIKRPRKIGFDLDDVLLNFSDALREHMNLKFGKAVERNAITSFYIEEAFNLKSEEVRETIDDFFLHQDHLEALPIPGAKEVVDKLKEDNDLYIITAKPEHLEENTYQWLEKHFPKSFVKAHFANFFGHKQRRKKSEICLELGIEIFIDDSLENARDVASVGIPVLLYDTPWNQSSDIPENVIRVYSWAEIGKHLL